MAKRGRKKKFKVSFNISPETSRSIIAVLLLLFSILAIISFIAPHYFLNEKIQLVFRKTLGYASFGLPLLTGVIGLVFIDSFKTRLKELRVVVGLVILLVSLAGLFHIFISPEMSKEVAINGGGGGFIGYVVGFGLRNLFSVFGGVALLAGLLIMSVILIFDISIDKAVEIYREKLSIVGLIKKKEGDKVEVTSGMPDESLEGEVISQSHGDIPDEPTFEIVPTMSEPQTGVDIRAMPAMNSDISDIAKISSNLPYADRVWELPSIDLLSEGSGLPPDTGDVAAHKKTIVDTLNSFDIPVEIVDVQVGPAVTKYALQAPPGVKLARIANLQSNLALALASPTGSVRIEAPIPGKALIGIEVPNRRRAEVDFRSLISSDQMKASKSKLEIVLGKDVGGITHIYDINTMPHLLIAGTTGSGKSVFIHNLIFSILFRATPQEVKLIMIDPKRVELSSYADIPHLYTPLITDTEKAPAVFKWAVTEMTRRYKLLESAKARNIDAYNEKSGFQALPYIVIIVDELGEIMVADPNAVEKNIIRLAQLARATGIHLVLAAQRPSADVITGLIKANIPCRVAFNVTGQVDSRVIIDQPGAEKLLGKGDMLFVPPDKPTPIRLQGAFVRDDEITRVVNFLKSQGVPPEYKEEIIENPKDDNSGKSISAGGDKKDPHYDEAVDIVVSTGRASASLLQRRLSIGYARAARILDELEESGVIGTAQGSRAREIISEAMPMHDGLPPAPNDIKAPRINLDE